MPLDRKPVVACVCLDFLKKDMQHIYRQVTGLKKFEPAILTRNRENADIFPFKEKHIAVLRKPRTRFFRRFWTRTVRKHPVQIYRREVKPMLYDVMRFGSDIVHIYFGHVAVQLLPFIRACPRPVVVSFHGADAGVDLDQPVHRASLQEVLQRADLVLARSRSLMDDLGSLGCPPEKIRLHRTGIPLENWPLAPRTIPPENGRWHFVQACRLIEKKGLPVTLETFAKVLEKYPNAHLTIAGDGPLRESLGARAGALGIDGSISFSGFLDQTALQALIREAHLFIHPSQTGTDGNREGVPNAMLEAMATGMPVLATEHGGIPEAVEHGRSGLLVPEKDTARLTRETLKLLNTPGLYQELSTGARQAIESAFSQEAQSTELETLYTEAISRRG